MKRKIKMAIQINGWHIVKCFLQQVFFIRCHPFPYSLHGELQISFNECGVLTHLAGLLDMCLTSYICIRVCYYLILSYSYSLYSGRRSYFR